MWDASATVSRWFERRGPTAAHAEQPRDPLQRQWYWAPTRLGESATAGNQSSNTRMGVNPSACSRFSRVAQSAEHLTVNQRVVGSSPTPGASFSFTKEYSNRVVNAPSDSSGGVFACFHAQIHTFASPREVATHVSERRFCTPSDKQVSLAHAVFSAASGEATHWLTGGPLNNG